MSPLALLVTLTTGYTLVATVILGRAFGYVGRRARRRADLVAALALAAGAGGLGAALLWRHMWFPGLFNVLLGLVAVGVALEYSLSEVRRRQDQMPARVPAQRIAEP